MMTRHHALLLPILMNLVSGVFLTYCYDGCCECVATDKAAESTLIRYEKQRKFA